MKEPIVIGIAGGTGSGKSTITRRLMQRFGNDVRPSPMTTIIKRSTKLLLKNGSK